MWYHRIHTAVPILYHTAVSTCVCVCLYVLCSEYFECGLIVSITYFPLPPVCETWNETANFTCELNVNCLEQLLSESKPTSRLKVQHWFRLPNSIKEQNQLSGESTFCEGLLL